jgi:hypothetical protein
MPDGADPKGPVIGLPQNPYGSRDPGHRNKGRSYQSVQPSHRADPDRSVGGLQDCFDSILAVHPRQTLILHASGADGDQARTAYPDPVLPVLCDGVDGDGTHGVSSIHAPNDRRLKVPGVELKQTVIGADPEHAGFIPQHTADKSICEPLRRSIRLHTSVRLVQQP